MSDSVRKILVVDDEPSIRESLSLLLKASFEVLTASDGEQALIKIEAQAPDLILLDITMPRMDGLETLKQLRQKGMRIPIIMLSASNTVRTAVEAMKCGAQDFVNKPFELDELTSKIISALECVNLNDQDAAAAQKERIALPPGDFGPMIGQSSTMAHTFAQVKQVAERDSTVLITGESGTGKELIAKQLHQLSPRQHGPFIAINCAAIPETLIESELFGHEKGAFTHAVDRRIGHFELADGGTLFLDEIGELSMAVQVKMLRFLQEQEFFRVGRSKPIRVDVRVVAATNKNLEQLIVERKFRQDLFYRLHVISLHLPALRDRFEDIPLLANYFVKKFSLSYGGRVLRFSTETLQALVQYDWPGNVRELENVVESLMALAPEDEVSPDHLPLRIRPRAHVSNGDSGNPLNYDNAEKSFETEIILKALKKSNYVQTRAAQLLGISRRILKYKMDKLGISEHEEIASGTENEDPV